MSTTTRRNPPAISEAKTSQNVPKAPTGIAGFDELTSGGLPRGRPTLVCGGAGCGKTVLGLEVLVRGATLFGEPGAIFSFEETSEELAANAASFGFDLATLIRQKKLVIDHIQMDVGAQETGAYDLDGLFIRLAHAIDSVGAKRVLLDTMESLFDGLENKDILRSELRRLFRWLKEKGVTAVITGERGESSLTRDGLEEYVSDCVILLDLRVQEQVATRRLRVVKYRGARHGADEYPFLITEHGLSVLPMSSLRLVHSASNVRLSSGVPELDSMLGGGYYQGSSILVSGPSGTGKTTIAACLASTCAIGARALYFSFEESPSQLTRNMKSVGVDLDAMVKDGVLHIISTRPSGFGLETHLFDIYRSIEEFAPSMVIIDPVTDFVSIGNSHEIRAMMTRLIDHLKTASITALMTSLSGAYGTTRDLGVSGEAGISALIDTWILLNTVETDGERSRTISVLKSRGTAHSNQIREFVLSERGVTLIDWRGDARARFAGQDAHAKQHRGPVVHDGTPPMAAAERQTR